MKTTPGWDANLAAEIIGRHKDTEGPLLPILHSLQHAFGYIPEPAEPMVAEALQRCRLPQFRHAPAGRHVLKLCQAEACQACGSDALAARAEEKLGVKLGETSADGRVTLEPVYCLGLCSVSPSAMIDGRIVGRLDANKLDALLAETSR